jgi:HAD superfamily hydrolase (TIGR01509 family)
VRLDGIDTVLLDVDGTLVDTTYLHAVCWAEALAEQGIVRPTADLHPLIGMASDLLLQTVLEDRPQAHALVQALKDRHLELYREHWPRLRPLPGAAQLLRHLKEQGLTTVLSSSASEEELTALRKALDADAWIDEATSSDDAEQGKPEPAMVHVGLRRTHTAPDRALFVGDAVWDGQAARRAGVRFVGLLCGGTTEAALREAGAEAVYADPAFLLAHL